LQFFEKAIKMNMSMTHSPTCNNKISEQAKGEKNISIQVTRRGNTSGVLTLPEKGHNRTAIIVAHGAGNDMQTPLITSFCRGLAASGYPVLRFNFLYTEQGRKAPDKQELLVETWRSVYRFAKEELGDKVDSCVAAGKSMGGRVASQMVSNNLLPVHGLIFLGYPLHSPSDKEKLRDAHLYQISIPMFFFAGTRDPLCDMEKLKIVLKSLKAPWELFAVEGGDHSFHVPKSMTMTEEEIYRLIIKKTVDWLTAGRWKTVPHKA
jgi:predicted alpha/beta-hydrolase family hydrolase